MAYHVITLMKVQLYIFLAVQFALCFVDGVSTAPNNRQTHVVPLCNGTDVVYLPHNRFCNVTV